MRFVHSNFAALLWMVGGGPMAAAWLPHPSPHGGRRFPTHLSSGGVEEMKQAWKTWQEEKLGGEPSESGTSALDLTQEMIEMAIDFVQTGKELPQAEGSTKDLEAVQQQLVDTLNDIAKRKQA